MSAVVIYQSLTDNTRKAAEALHVRERKEFLDANATKFASANREAWEKEYDRDPQGTREHFAKAPDIIPANQVGHSVDKSTDDDDADPVATTRADAGYQSWKVI